MKINSTGRHLWLALNSIWGVITVAALLGFGAFAYIYGLAIINPGFTDWLLVGGDLSQHYIGWQFFQQSDWTFPVGVASDLAYPHGLAVTFMDSIPLLAIPFKVFSYWLPNEFQYFGIWGLLCFILQAVFTVLIVRRWTSSLPVLFSSAAVLVLTPPMLGRMFTHTALAGHWIILLAILLILSSKTLTNKIFVVVWSVTLSISVLIHPYFLFMLVPLLVVAVVLRYRNALVAVATGAIPITCSMLVFWLIGGFTITSVAADGLGDFALNINSLINPLGWSSVLPELGHTRNHFEGLNYIGLGLLLGGCALAFYGVVNFRRVFSEIKRLQSHWLRYSLVTIVLTGLIIASLSPTIHIGSRVLLEYDLPTIVEKLWSVLRASGRLFWPVYYLIIFSIIFGSIKVLSCRPAWLAVVFIVLLSVQVLDVTQSFNFQERRIAARAFSGAKYQTPLVGNAWKDIAVDRRHVVYIGGLYGEDFTTISQFAITNGLTLNTGYFARSPAKAIEVEIDRAIRQLLLNQPDRDTLYIFRDSDLAKRITDNVDMMISQLDGFYVIKSHYGNQQRSN